MRDYYYLFKLVLVRDGAVGKTSLAHRFLLGLFSEDTRQREYPHGNYVKAQEDRETRARVLHSYSQSSPRY